MGMGTGVQGIGKQRWCQSVFCLYCGLMLNGGVLDINFEMFKCCDRQC